MSRASVKGASKAVEGRPQQAQHCHGAVSGTWGRHDGGPRGVAAAAPLFNVTNSASNL